MALVPAMIDLMLRETSLDECVERDIAWGENYAGWRGHLFHAITNTTSGADVAMFWQASRLTAMIRQCLLPTRDRDLAKMRLLICDLAIRAYSIEHGRHPAKLPDLVPSYLPEAPKDPFGGGQLVYRLTPNGYLLYSVGVNGVDDGGKSSDLAGLGESGDILLDDSPSPPARPTPTSP